MCQCFLCVYSCINEEKKHHSFSYYTEGLNTDSIPFNPSNTCSIGGLYFTTSDFIIHFVKYGCFLSEIEIPDNNAHCYVEANKIKSDQLIVKALTHISDSTLWNDLMFNKKDLPWNM
jgi:hypothetical protein